MHFLPDGEKIMVATSFLLVAGIIRRAIPYNWVQLFPVSYSNNKRHPQGAFYYCERATKSSASGGKNDQKYAKIYVITGNSSYIPAPLLIL